jgi:uncharacterized repeat protein (TIGR03943 family)
VSSRAQRTLQALVLAGLGLFLLQKAWSGTLTWYINERLGLLVLAAALGLLVLGRSVLPAWRAAPSLEGEAAHEHAGTEAHPHEGHDHQQATPGWRLWMVALPLILGLLVPARPLGSAALANRGLNSVALLSAANSVAIEPAAAMPEARTVLDWVRAFNVAGDPAAYAGAPADVVGFVYHDSTLPHGQFIISRFAVTCCAADAMGVGVAVRWPGAAALEGDAWVRVRGPVQVGAYRGSPIPVIVAESVEGVEAPGQPYLVR